MTEVHMRSVPFELRADESGDGRTLEGYAAVFGEWTEINDWDGQYLEQIARGAFTKTLSERTPVLQFDHGRHPMVGSIPLGHITKLKEDSKGLYVQARLADNWLVQPVRDAIASGAIDGMSFRFRTIADKREAPAKYGDLERRTITEVKLFELGPVVFPAYEATSVGVRAHQALDLLSDPSVRADLARLFLGTPTAPAACGTDAAEPPSADEPPFTALRGTPIHALRARRARVA